MYKYYKNCSLHGALCIRQNINIDIEHCTGNSLSAEYQYFPLQFADCVARHKQCTPPHKGMHRVTVTP